MKLSSLPVTGCDAQLVLSGEDFFSCFLQMVQRAAGFIHLHTYAWLPDTTGDEIHKALLQAAARGVKIFVVVDSYGTKLPEAYISQMKEAGIQFSVFSPLSPLRVGRRLHQKILVTGAGEALIGGINISDKYRGEPGTEPWLDFAVRLTGPVVQHITALCELFWKKRKRISFKPVTGATGNKQIRLVQNNWYRGKHQISASYRNQIEAAQKEVLIVASYFLPGHRIRRAIAGAAARGVKIRILLSGISDVPFVKPATQFLYDWLFRCGVEIYEWKRSVQHGKVMVVDGNWVTIGSYNINSLSDYGSAEVNVNITDADFARHVLQTIENLLQQGSEQLSLQGYQQKRNPAKQLGNWFSYYLLRLSARFFLWLSDDAQTGKR